MNGPRSRLLAALVPLRGAVDFIRADVNPPK
jgi:hypothetical protein